MGQVKLGAPASSEAEAECQGSLAIWPSLPIGESCIRDSGWIPGDRAHCQVESTIDASISDTVDNGGSGSVTGPGISTRDVALYFSVLDMTKARGLGLQNQLTLHKFSWTCRVSVWTYAISRVSPRLSSVPVPFLMSLPSLIYSSTLWAVGRWRGRGPHSDTKYIYPHAKHR
ncbi:hypothetical protein AOLI_G00017870 [Acnodon oligacanthus]